MALSKVSLMLRNMLLSVILSMITPSTNCSVPYLLVLFPAVLSGSVHTDYRSRTMLDITHCLVAGRT